MADLVVARGVHDPLRIVEPQAGGVPLEPDEVDHRAADLLGAGDEPFVVKIECRDFQDRAPVAHQLLVLPVVVAQVTEIVGLEVGAPEALKETRKAGVERVADTMYHARPREELADQAEVQEVIGHLVGHPQRVRAQRPELG